jgi:hypothetical protein
MQAPQQIKTDRENRQFRRAALSVVPWGLREHAKQEYERRHKNHGEVNANLWLRGIRDAGDQQAWRTTESDDEIRATAERRATACRRTAIIRHGQGNLADVIIRQCGIYGIEAASSVRKITPEGIIKRACCHLWWRRKLRSQSARRTEAIARELNLVHSHASLYASDEAVNRRKQQKKRNRALLASMEAVNEIEQAYGLDELAELGVANPEIRRAELMVRMRGFEEIAKKNQDVSIFYTWTLPSRYHSHHAASGERNSEYDGATPRDGQKKLTTLWARARAYLAQRGIKLYGIRVVEPHHDGCPHWHMLLSFQARWPGSTERAAAGRVNAILRRYALSEDGGEAGAKNSRFTAKPIDYRRGSATGYLAKYIAKNINAAGIDSDHEDISGLRNPAECAKRVDAWASTWGIRQFQQIGGPPVGEWREARRLRDSVQEQEQIEAIRAAADKSAWGLYIEAQGGITMKRSNRRVKIAKIWSDKMGRYDEAIGAVVIGLEAQNVTIMTRLHIWRVQRINRGLDRVQRENKVAYREAA